jgi:hypothetical protein
MDDPSTLATLAALLSAMRDHAVATGRGRLAHLCTAGLYGGDLVAIARVTAAIDGIDTSPTAGDGVPREIEV